MKRSDLQDFQNLRNVGLRAIHLREGDEVVSAQLTDGTGDIFVATHQGMVIRFEEQDVRAMGRTATGVRAIKLREDDYVVGMTVARDDAELLVITEKGYGKRTVLDAYRAQSRGGYGVRSIKVSQRTGLMVALKCVDDGDEIMMITSDGTVIRLPASQISTIGRATQGIRLMRLRDGDQVVAVAVVAHDAESEEAELASLPEPEEGDEADMELTAQEAEEDDPSDDV